ncbi:RNA polymerase sigma factor [Sphingomonas sp. MMS24-J45]|uniref:RNA polymerase sigma factor n=1 Tax=Sphingomonas sp. MMS24-J45 TaxID=3238806 RepID=UPI00384E4885
MFDDACVSPVGDVLEDAGTVAPSRPADPIELLLLRTRDADQRAFRRLYDLTASRLLSKATAILGSRDAAEDTLQEAYVRIWRHARQFDPARGNASVWIMRVLRNAAIDRLRQDRTIARYQSAGDDLPDIPIAPEPVADRLDLERSLAQLRPEQRTTICRVVVQGWTHEEVAIADHVPTPTAKARAQRGLVRLRVALSEPGSHATVGGEWVKAVA